MFYCGDYNFKYLLLKNSKLVGSCYKILAWVGRVDAKVSKASNMSSLFHNLGKYLPAENYLTNVLVALLTELLKNGDLRQDKDVALEVLNLIAKKKEQPDFSLDETICIKAQERADGQQPDITISSNLPGGTSRTVYIEVKDRDDVGEGQLVRYKRLLDKSHAEIRCLTLLCRPTTPIKPEDAKALKNQRVYWSEVYDTIKKSENRAQVSKYLLDSFIQFLEEKNMQLKKITGECASIKRESLDDLISLVDMLPRAMKEAGFERISGIELQSSPETEPDEEIWTFVGFYGDYNSHQFSAGIHVYPNSPTELKLELQKEPDYPPNELKWTELQSLSSADQLRRLQTFLKENAKQLLRDNVKHPRS